MPRSEREKMESGVWYDANFDPQLLRERMQAADLCFELEHTRPSDIDRKKKILAELVPHVHESVEILTPFYCDYGRNIHIGEAGFLNHGCYLMDGAPIRIGKHAFIGPFCGFYTANHALNHEQRNAGLELAQPINIGDNVWLGANVTVLPGVTIGEGSVIGAGSVVAKDIPPNVLAMGTPCRVIREITEADRIVAE